MKVFQRDPLVHYIDGRKAWNLGWGGLILRYKAQAGAAVFTFVSSGAFLEWWSAANALPESITVSVNVRWLICIWAALLVGIGGGALLYLRRRTIRSLNIKNSLHRLAHGIRDNQTALYKKMSLNSPLDDTLVEELESALPQICNGVSKYFQLLSRDQHIGVAIRLAVEMVENDPTSTVFKTVARSDTMNPNRQHTSESIKQSEGIPRLFLEDGPAQGVLIYYDLEEAANKKTFVTLKNQKRYPEEIKCLMAAPLNAWDGTQHSLIGLIFISSGVKNIFQAKDVDALLFISDITASAIADIIALCAVKEQREGKEREGA